MENATEQLYFLVLKAETRQFETCPCTKDTIHEDIADAVDGWQQYLTSVTVPGGLELSLYCNDSAALTNKYPVNAAAVHFYGGPLYGDLAAAYCPPDGEGAPAGLPKNVADSLVNFFNTYLKGCSKEYYDAWQRRAEAKRSEAAKTTFRTFSSFEEMQAFIEEQKANAVDDRLQFEEEFEELSDTFDEDEL